MEFAFSRSRSRMATNNCTRSRHSMIGWDRIRDPEYPKSVSAFYLIFISSSLEKRSKSGESIAIRVTSHLSTLREPLALSRCPIRSPQGPFYDVQLAAFQASFKVSSVVYCRLRWKTGLIGSIEGFEHKKAAPDKDAMTRRQLTDPRGNTVPTW